MTDTLDRPEAVPMSALEYGLADPREVGALTGLELLQAFVGKRLPAPPIAGTMHQWISEVEEGSITFLGDPDPRYLNPMGLIHGGWTMALIDSSLGCAVQTTLARGESFVSLGTEVKFIRPVLVDTGQVRCRAEVQSRGKAHRHRTGLRP
ncbi:PaaI family thioesterase [Breoghania sp.]|uniref:PaaI family thioesterase n=1 Tax=Breoghania sp. TaxID=2065378 RepID=UPI0026141D96|nr:PaaI family thioesterase [Breoghania sp.]MDJ0933483.1 PaaI family thioesterase [Breoghania sp.]